MKFNPNLMNKEFEKNISEKKRKKTNREIVKRKGKYKKVFNYHVG